LLHSMQRRKYINEKDEAKLRLRELFSSQSLAALSTHHDGQPYASLVAFYSSDDLRHIYFVTPKTTRKYANLAADHRVALVEPDRWILDRSRNTVVTRTPSERKCWMIPGPNGVRLAELRAEKSAHPSLSPRDVNFVFKTARQAEESFKMPQDVEWTYDGDSLVLP